MIDPTAVELQALCNQPVALRFPAQARVAADKARKRALVCGRQSGKTEEIILEHVEHLAEPDRGTVFIGLTKSSAKRIFYRRFKEMNRSRSWGLTPNDTDLFFRHANGNVCYVFGADTESDIDRARGLTKIALFTLDECGQWKQSLLKYCVEEVAFPATGAVAGAIMVSGTPPRVLSGYFVDIIRGAEGNWSLHKWTARDNPYMPPNYLDEVLSEFGWREDNPIFQREYLANLARDEGYLIFPFDPERHVSTAPEGVAWNNWLIVDFGNVHATAYTIMSQSPKVKPLYIRKNFKAAGQAPSEVADVCLDLIRRYKVPSHHILGDLGGLGKGYAAELGARHGVHMYCVEKRDKLASIELLIDAFRTNSIMSDPGNEQLHLELDRLTWNDDHSDIAQNQKDDSTMTIVYGNRMMSGLHLYSYGTEDDERPRHKQDNPYGCQVI